MHAEDLNSAIKRLTQKPMDIAPAYIPLMNIVLTVQRVRLEKKKGQRRIYRRVLSVDEIADYEDYRKIFKWRATKDDFLASLNNSVMLSTISERSGITKDELIKEIQRRKKVLHWMRQRKIRSYKEVAAIIAEYYVRPDEFYNRLLKMEKLGEEAELLAAVGHH